MGWACSALFRENADSIVAGWWQLHNELAHTQQSDAGYPAWGLKNPDVGYTKPIPGETADTGAQEPGSVATNDASLIEQLHAAREKVKELERKVAELERAKAVE